MRHYPAHTAEAVLASPAIRVLMLIEHAIRADSADIEREIMIAQASRAAPDELKSLRNTLERNQDDILESAGHENDYSAIKKLKEIMTPGTDNVSRN